MAAPASRLSLIERTAATEKTLAKYRSKPFCWKSGATCIHLARFHARNLGHKPPAIPRFQSAIGARTALKSTGHATLESLLDSMFERIPPAFMLVGDLAMLEGDDDGGETFGSLAVYSGLTMLLGWHESAPEGVRPCFTADGNLKAAWRL